MTIPKLVNFNNIQTPYRIYPNQKIFIPKKRIHIVKEGETLYAISRRYKTDLFSIAKFNKLKNVNQINANQKLIIPDQFKTPKKKLLKAKRNKPKIKEKKEITKKKINKKPTIIIGKIYLACKKKDLFQTMEVITQVFLMMVLILNLYQELTLRHPKTEKLYTAGMKYQDMVI